MVEYTAQLNSIFQSLADPTRRDILRRLIGHELSIGELAEEYNVSFAAISKHLSVLERAKLVRKQKEGKKQMVAIVPETLKNADDYLRQYQQMWESRYNKLDELLKEGE